MLSEEQPLHQSMKKSKGKKESTKGKKDAKGSSNDQKEKVFQYSNANNNDSMMGRGGILLDDKSTFAN